MVSLKHSVGIAFFLSLSVLVSVGQQVDYCVVARELKTLQTHLVPDKRLAILEIELKDTLNPKVTVKGETDIPEAKLQIVSFLKGIGVVFEDSIRVLPDHRLGDRTWALASLSVSNLRAGPDHAAELVSQVSMGTPLRVLDKVDNWYRVQTPEHYIGWMDSGGMQLVGSEGLEAWRKSRRYLFGNPTGYVLESPRRNAEKLSDLVCGDLMEAVDKSKRFLKVRLPDGREGYVYRKQCLPFESWSSGITNAETVLKVAKQMMGIPYLWGGTSVKAVDCSGFIKTVFYSQGIIVARDASQQARYGEVVPLNGWHNLLPGDLLFFGVSDARITHVGIYLGNSYFIHASGRVHVSSLNPNDPLYVASRHHVATRRILNSVGKVGINTVREHPWY